MKNFKKLSWYVLPIALLLSSCKEDDEAAQPTPNKPNTEAIVLEDIKVKTVLEDRNTDPQVADYFVKQDVRVMAELTIKPGVVIAFAENTGLSVEEAGGILIAKGEPTNKIVFTGEGAHRGFWKGITVFSNSQANEFSHTEIKYAGSYPTLFNQKAALSVFKEAKVAVKNTLIMQSGGYGLHLAEHSILNSFAANTFKDNLEAPLLTAVQNIPKLDGATAFTGNNGRDIIEVTSSSITGTGEVVWPAFTDKTPYRFLGRVTAQTGWKLSPGITIEVVENQMIDVEDGYLNAVGTPEKKITFTGVIKTGASWNGILFYTHNPANVMKQVQISYAGANSLLSGVKSSIALFGTDAANLTITQSSISHSGGYGIHVYGQDATLNADAETSNTFTANALKSVYYED
ncbi:hypothetical protein HUW51_05345 [Adhaeribacter swui]|uniref:Right-handed parallel beta-helix repeat-containing protein n=1 Tax=Adhaeribacter swui TaxID=2086471 RepID=A0A7G7G4U5_9BACT|nr:hypothetical protein [Adhaeribacter swui]QNF32179.1 hypothetical protein HUW51_05345 [Adhaeribacter swui]